MPSNRSESKTLEMLPGRSLRRWTFALLGLLSIAVGFIGVFLPGLPTTIFLLLASYCFARSCPWLEDKLVKAPIFRPYLRYLDKEQGMPLRARLVTIALIWVASGTSCFVLYLKGDLESWFVLTIGAAALIGTIVVSLIYRGTRTSNGPSFVDDDRSSESIRTGATAPTSTERCPIHRGR